jgi:predicted CXXCH cytochrome family protein
MKKLIFILIAVLALSAIAFGQPGGKQPMPNYIGNPETTATNIYGKGWSLGKTGKGVGIQGVRAGMLKGPHDFTPDSGKYIWAIDSITTPGVKDTSWHVTTASGASKGICGYCHDVHVPVTGVAKPLWARKSVSGKTFGLYANVSSIDATIYDPGTANAAFKDNYSSMCLSCHDGSAGMFAPTKYERGSGTTGDVSKMPNAYAFTGSGELALTHTHPVNFDYNAVQALVPDELYPAMDPVSAVYKGYNGAWGVGGSYTSVRLFNGTMQCSSCHNPHMSSGIGTTLTSDYGRRCVACHKK